MSKTLEEIKTIIKELQAEAEELELGVLNSIPKSVLKDLQKRCDALLELADCEASVAELELVVKKYPVYVFYNVAKEGAGYFDVADLEPVSEYIVIETKTHVHDFDEYIEAHSDVKKAIKDKNKEAAAFFKEIKKVAKKYGCSVEMLLDNFDPGYVLH